MPGQESFAPIVSTRQLAGQPGDALSACTKYSIVGKYAASGPAQFVQHVGLIGEDCLISPREEVGVLHMGPPLIAGARTQATSPRERRCRADIVGDLALNAEEREAIDDWLSEVETEDRNHPLNPFEQYTIVPHVDWITAPETGRRIRRKFSCTGFVVEAYARAQIELIDLDQELPDIDVGLVYSAYPDLARMERATFEVREHFGFIGREQFGLRGDGPWKIILAGYLFHSTARATQEAPRPAGYLPHSAAEGSFPLPPLVSTRTEVTPESPL